jgi:hypothetical protein
MALACIGLLSQIKNNESVESFHVGISPAVSATLSGFRASVITHHTFLGLDVKSKSQQL